MSEQENFATGGFIAPGSAPVSDVVSHPCKVSAHEEKEA